MTSGDAARDRQTDAAATRRVPIATIETFEHLGSLLDSQASSCI
jgi:hypothetical protein